MKIVKEEVYIVFMLICYNNKKCHFLFFAKLYLKYNKIYYVLYSLLKEHKLVLNILPQGMMACLHPVNLKN